MTTFIEDQTLKCKKGWYVTYLIWTVFYFLCGATIASAQEPDWQELKSEHFIVNFVDDEKFAKKVSRKSENGATNSERISGNFITGPPKL